MVLGYFFRPLELIEKYKYAMPNEIELLIFSTIMLIFFVLSIGRILNRRGKNQESIPNKDFLGKFALLSILSLLFFLYMIFILQIAFSKRNDPLFNYFLENYFIYTAIYIILVIAIPYLINWLPFIVKKIIYIIQNYD